MSFDVNERREWNFCVKIQMQINEINEHESRMEIFLLTQKVIVARAQNVN
jgi:hypothetical protein